MSLESMSSETTENVDLVQLNHEITQNQELFDSRVGDVSENNQGNSLDRNDNYDPDKRVAEHDVSNTQRDVSYSPDNRVSETRYTTESERINKTPSYENTNGFWEGERGNSKYLVTDETAKSKLEEFGKDGIEYRNGEPDFSDIAKEEVSIDMTAERYSYCNGNGEKVVGNFDRADQACADKWNSEARDGKTDWTKADVAKYRSDNNLTWHECNDMKTCQLIDKDIHAVCSHSGGVAECKRRDNVNGGGFDD